MTASAHALDQLAVAARAADAKGGEDLVALDVSGAMPFADVFLLVTGSSERQVLAIADEVEDRSGSRALRREGREHGRWVLLDFGDLVVHVFHREDRMYYGLERLWLDCPAIPVAPLLDGPADGAAEPTAPAAPEPGE